MHKSSTDHTSSDRKRAESQKDLGDEHPRSDDAPSVSEDDEDNRMIVRVADEQGRVRTSSTQEADPTKDKHS